jgi:hypothetical protein
MRLFLVGLLLLLPVSLRAESFSLDAETWARPRSGDTWLHNPTLVQALAAFERMPSGVIVLAHAPGDDGALWAEELRSWLVALGVPSAKIDVKVDDAASGVTLDVRAGAS